MIEGPRLQPRSLDAELEARAAQFAPGALPEAAPRSAPAPDPEPPFEPGPQAQPERPRRLDWQQTLTFSDNESIASILLKMEQVPSREIAIVAPPHLKVFRNPVSMRLLQRKAQDLGLEVTIVSQDEMTRNLCWEAGFGCYGDERRFRRENSRPRRFDQPLPAGHLRWLSLAVAACLLGAIVFVAYFVLPAASITLTAASSNLAVDVSVVADPTINAPDAADGKIPARTVTSGDVEGSTTVRASGQREVPNQPARGSVTFTNLTDQPVTVPKNTVLLAGKTAFFTVSDTLVSPSVKIAGTAIPGGATAAIQAADGGTDGNVPVGAITAVQGALASKVSVVNHAAISGGSNKKGSYLSSEDQAQSKEALLGQLRQQALAKIGEQIARNETFLASPTSDGDGAVEELTYAESPEQVTGETTLHMKVMVRGLAFQGDDVNQVVAQAMDAAARAKGNGARLSNQPLRIDPPVVTANDGSSIKLRVHTTGQVMAPVDGPALATQVRGMAPTAAKRKLEAVPGVGHADVQLWPVWARTVPSFAWRIHTAVASPAG